MDKKTSEKFRPLMCKILENGARLATWRRSPRATHAGVRNGCGPSSRARLRSPVLQQRHEPIARGPGGVASSLPCGTVSNVIEAPKAPRGVGCDVGLRSDFPAGLRPSKPFVGIAAAVRGDAERENVTSCVTSCGATSRRLQRR